MTGRSVREINWDYLGDALPAFITILMIPLTYKFVFPSLHVHPETKRLMNSIAYGVIAGLGCYIVLNTIPWAFGKVSGGRWLPPTIEAAEVWVIPPGGIVPPWMYVLRPLSSLLVSYIFLASNSSAAPQSPTRRTIWTCEGHRILARQTMTTTIT